MDVVRLIGGPCEVNALGVGMWPPPDEIKPSDISPLQLDGAGVYRKTSQSALTDEDTAATTHLVRGAEYEWVPVEASQ